MATENLEPMKEKGYPNIKTIALADQPYLTR